MPQRPCQPKYDRVCVSVSRLPGEDKCNFDMVSANFVYLLGLKNLKKKKEEVEIYNKTTQPEVSPK